MLKVSEHFYSIQGEGLYTGVPAVFLRLGGCNLSCGGKNTLKTGDLSDGATWRCDTIEVWSKYLTISTEKLVNLFLENGYVDKLNEGAHLVITGGEPLLQMPELIEFIKQLKLSLKKSLFIEIETNGTITPSKLFDGIVNQYNVSPKLQNSGVREKNRIIEDSIAYFCKSKKAIFKFVVGKQSDIDELEQCYRVPFNIPANNIYLMPAADNSAVLSELTEQVILWCIDKCFCFSNRLHIQLWNQKTGV